MDSLSVSTSRPLAVVVGFRGSTISQDYAESRKYDRRQPLALSLLLKQNSQFKLRRPCLSIDYHMQSCMPPGAWGRSSVNNCVMKRHRRVVKTPIWEVPENTIISKLRLSPATEKELNKAELGREKLGLKKIGPNTLPTIDKTIQTASMYSLFQVQQPISKKEAPVKKDSNTSNEEILESKFVYKTRSNGIMATASGKINASRLAQFSNVDKPNKSISDRIKKSATSKVRLERQSLVKRSSKKNQQISTDQQFSVNTPNLQNAQGPEHHDNISSPKRAQRSERHDKSTSQQSAQGSERHNKRSSHQNAEGPERHDKRSSSEKVQESERLEKRSDLENAQGYERHDRSTSPQNDQSSERQYKRLGRQNAQEPKNYDKRSSPQNAQGHAHYDKGLSPLNAQGPERHDKRSSLQDANRSRDKFSARSEQRRASHRLSKTKRLISQNAPTENRDTTRRSAEETNTENTEISARHQQTDRSLGRSNQQNVARPETPKPFKRSPETQDSAMERSQKSSAPNVKRNYLKRTSLRSGTQFTQQMITSPLSEQRRSKLLTMEVGTKSKRGMKGILKKRKTTKFTLEELQRASLQKSVSNYQKMKAYALQIYQRNFPCTSSLSRENYTGGAGTSGHPVVYEDNSMDNFGFGGFKRKQRRKSLKKSKANNFKNTDNSPAARLRFYQRQWLRFRKNIPGDDSRPEIRSAVRTRLSVLPR